MGSHILSPYSFNYCYMPIKSEEPKTKDNINNKTHQYPTKENWPVQILQKGIIRKNIVYNECI